MPVPLIVGAGVGALALLISIGGPRLARGGRVRLSPHFTLAELTTTSQRADNTPGWGEILALRALAREVLEPIRALLGVPLRVTSGYRSPEVNRLVGGSSTSDHMEGTAADIVPIGRPAEESFRLIAAAVRSGRILADQVIYYPHKGHIHIGYRAEQSRRQLMIARPDGSFVPYSEVT